jgi:hypothetical protein
MSRKISTTLLFFALAAGAVPAGASIIGPGNNTPTNNDNAGSLTIVDTVNSQSLGAGLYVANQFNYAFVNTGGPTLTGDVQPFLAVADPANLGSYEVVAVGASVPYSVVESYASHPFGGGTSADFSLGTTTTVYAGFYWDGDNSGNEGSPIGFNGNGLAGQAYIHYFGADAPVIGSDLAGGTTSGGPFARIYDFSVGVAFVPEPSTVLSSLSILATIGLYWGFRRGRRS